MAFSVNQMVVDGAGKVVSLHWAYSNNDGTLSNTHKLHKPYGDQPLKEVTEKVAIEWLESQISNTAEDFDACLARRKAEAEYNATLEDYTVHTMRAPTRVARPELEKPSTLPAPEEELEVSTMPAPEEEPEAGTMPAKRSKKK